MQRRVCYYIVTARETHQKQKIKKLLKKQNACKEVAKKGVLRKEERWQYIDKRITVEGKTFDVRLCFPTEPTDSVTDKLLYLISGRKS